MCLKIAHYMTVECIKWTQRLLGHHFKSNEQLDCKIISGKMF